MDPSIPNLPAKIHRLNDGFGMHLFRWRLGRVTAVASRQFSYDQFPPGKQGNVVTGITPEIYPAIAGYEDQVIAVIASIDGRGEWDDEASLAQAAAVTRADMPAELRRRRVPILGVCTPRFFPTRPVPGVDWHGPEAYAAY